MRVKWCLKKADQLSKPGPQSGSDLLTVTIFESALRREEKRKSVRVKHLTPSAPLWSPSNIISSGGGSSSSSGPASRREPLAGSPPTPTHIWVSENSAAAAPSGNCGMLTFTPASEEEEEEEDF